MNAVPADAFGVPAVSGQVIAFVLVGRVVMRSGAFCVRVIQTIERYALAVIGISADAFIFPAHTEQIVLFARTGGIEMLAGVWIVQTVHDPFGRRPACAVCAEGKGRIFRTFVIADAGYGNGRDSRFDVIGIAQRVIHIERQFLAIKANDWLQRQGLTGIRLRGDGIDLRVGQIAFCRRAAVFDTGMVAKVDAIEAGSSRLVRCVE